MGESVQTFADEKTSYAVHLFEKEGCSVCLQKHFRMTTIETKSYG